MQYVLTAATEAGLDRKAAYRLRLAVDEIATNIITHGYLEAHLDGDVVVNASVGDEQLVIILEDSAPAFDPRAHEIPDHIDKPSDERPIGGLGVFLAIKNVDGLDYEYRDHKNRNILTMNRPTPPAADVQGAARAGPRPGRSCRAAPGALVPSARGVRPRRHQHGQHDDSALVRAEEPDVGSSTPAQRAPGPLAC